MADPEPSPVQCPNEVGTGDFQWRAKKSATTPIHANDIPASPEESEAGIFKWGKRKPTMKYKGARTVNPPKPQRTLSPEPVPSTQEEAVKPPSRPATPPPPPEPVPSTQEEPVKPPSRPATPPPPTFRDLRQELFRQVHVNVMNGGKFADVELSLYTRRTKTGGPYLPKVLGVSKRLLSAASEEFEKQIFAKNAVIVNDGYASDSDLEEDIEVIVSDVDSQDCPASSAEETETVVAASPTVDAKAADATSPIHEEQHDGLDKQTFINAPHDGAFRTWQALALYLYDFNDHIVFNPLRSHTYPISLGNSSEVSPCSPKSMYRLADKLELVELKYLAREAIRKYITPANIVRELFSDFTWRYPDILSMETEIFYKYSEYPTVQVDMNCIFTKIAGGQLPHSSVVLKSLFTSLVRKNGPSSEPVFKSGARKSKS